MPLSDTELERAVLGAILLDPTRLESVQKTGLKESHFYEKRHGIIYEAMFELVKSGGELHLVSLVSQLKEMPGRMGKFQDRIMECGGHAYLAELSEAATSGASADYDACKVMDYGNRRHVKQTAEEVAASAAKPGFDAKGQLASIESVLIDAMEAMTPINESPSIKHLAENALTSFKKVHEGGALGLKTGFHELDSLSGGIMPGSFVLVAGRPSMGKTTMAVNISENIARRGHHVLFCSVEVGGDLLIENLVCSVAEVSPMVMRGGGLGDHLWEKVSNSVDEVKELPITVESAPTQSVATIALSARRTHRKRPLGLIVVDYLQLLSSEKRFKSRYEEVTALSRDLKGLARMMGVPVLCVSQLSRETDKRKGGTPQLSDLRDSGAIEQDADQVILLYRPEYYNPDSELLKGRAEVILAKNRHGPTGSVDMRFEGDVLRFSSYTEG